MILHTKSKDEAQYFLDSLDVEWYIDFGNDFSSVPSGYTKVPYVWLNSSTNLMSDGEIATMVNSAPAGSYWYVGGEPNTSPTNISGADFADVFNHFYTNIKAADSTAKVMSPSILNWWFGCTGCLGYTLGKDWVDQFRASYKAKYGTEPPVDVWNIDIYPIDWDNPPTVNSNLAIEQITGGNHPYLSGQPFLQGMRAYLDAIPEYINTPIWVTEIALHWGYEGWEVLDDYSVEPVGKYCEQEVANYLVNVMTWFRDNASAYKIEKWFQFITYADIVNINIPAYSGITLFEGPNSGASLTNMGKIYKDLIHGSPISIDISSLPSCP